MELLCPSDWACRDWRITIHLGTFFLLPTVMFVGLNVYHVTYKYLPVP